MTANKDQYGAMASRWKMARDAAAGEYEVHNGGELYLPKLTGEKSEEYEKRKKRTPFFNATWRTIIMLRGMMFRRDPSAVVPPQMVDELKNIDNTGMPLKTFAQELSLEALIVGRSGVLVDYTQVKEGVTRADATNARAFMRLYHAENMLDWTYTNDNGMKVLSMVSLAEDKADHPDINFDESDQVKRVLRLTDAGYIQQVIVATKDGDVQVGGDINPKMNSQSLNFIPFQPIGVDSLQMKIEVPPLIDLITMNFHHYRQTSSYEHGCYLSGLPTLFIYGNSDDEKTIQLGGSSANSFTNPETKAEFVEVSSKFEALENNITKKEHQMAVLGARMLESKTAGVESAETWERKQSGEESVLSDIATTLSGGMTQSLKWYAEWQGHASEDILYNLNREFLPFNMTAQQITAMMAAHIQRGISYDTLYYNFDRAGLYPPESTKETEKGAIDDGGGEI